MRYIGFAGSLAAMAAGSQAQHLSKQCFSDVCYQLNIPLDTSRSGSGDVYFQLSAPSSYSWIALGQGSQMAGSNMFIVYSDGQGNVTLSPRLGTGHNEPEYDRAANVTLLEGSGVTSDRMVANVVCQNCQQWNGGSTDWTSSAGSWIHASRSGSALDSTEVSADIEQHQDHGSFNFDYTTARGGANVNPFVVAQQTSSNSTGGGTGSGSGVSQAPSGISSGGDGSSSGGDSDTTDTIVTAHGTLSSIVYLVFFPVGAILVRIPGLSIWIHAGFQVFAYCCFIASAGLGIYAAMQLGEIGSYHPIIGLVLLGLLFFQPLGGLLHHRAYKAKGKRTAVSYVHVWVGRAAILLGIINGGLGIMLAGDVEQKYIIAYSVVAGVMGAVFLATIVYGEVVVAKRGSPDARNGRSKEDSSDS